MWASSSLGTSAVSCPCWSRGGGPSVPMGQTAVEVRSVKMGYREHYRGMLDDIARRCASLLLDSRATTRLRLSSAWRTERAVLEQQLEFLRHTLDDARFRGAVDEVMRNPHRRLEDERREQSISRPFRAAVTWRVRSAARVIGLRCRSAIPSGCATPPDLLAGAGLREAAD